MLSLVWQETEVGPRVRRVFLPREDTLALGIALTAFPGAVPRSCPAIEELCERIERFLEGEDVRLELDIVALESCSRFQRRVLLAEYEIPRGWVSTYGGIARSLETQGGARAVGGALARNPFPIIVPCHRAIRADHRLGGFQGGLKMKRALLELEGVPVSPAGIVLTDRFYH